VLALVPGRTIDEPAPQLTADLGVPAPQAQARPVVEDYRSLMQLEGPPLQSIVDTPPSTNVPADPVRPPAPSRVERKSTPAAVTTPGGSASVPPSRSEPRERRPPPTEPPATKPASERPRVEPKATPPARPEEIEPAPAEQTPTDAGAGTVTAPAPAPPTAEPVEAAVTDSSAGSPIIDPLSANPATGEPSTEQSFEPAWLSPTGSAPAETTTSPIEVAPPEPPAPTARRGDLVPLGEVDTRPVPLKQTLPEYDPLSRRMRHEGTVVLNVLIDEQGRVTRVEQIKGIPSSRLNAEAVRTVKGWRYRPATKDGVPVKVWMTLDLDFRL
jgi:protein TonB